MLIAILYLNTFYYYAISKIYTWSLKNYNDVCRKYITKPEHSQGIKYG